MRTVTLVLAGLTLITLGIALGQQWRAAADARLPAEARDRLRRSLVLVAFSLMLAAATILV